MYWRRWLRIVLLTVLKFWEVLCCWLLSTRPCHHFWSHTMELSSFFPRRKSVSQPQLLNHLQGETASKFPSVGGKRRHRRGACRSLCKDWGAWKGDIWEVVTLAPELFFLIRDYTKTQIFLDLWHWCQIVASLKNQIGNVLQWSTSPPSDGESLISM